MNRLTSILVVAVVGFALMWCPVASAQSGPDSGTEREAQLVNLDFPGGSVVDYVAALRKAVRDVNIVVMPAAQDLEVPPVQLQSVGLGSALQLIQGRFNPDERTVVEIEVADVSVYEDGEGAVWRVSAEIHRRGRPSSMETRVWCVADLRDTDTPPEAVLTAVETAVGLLAEDYPPAEIRFHEATGLIIARGHREQVGAIDQVLDELRGNRKRAQTSEESKETQEQAEELKRLIDERGREVAELSEQILQLKAGLREREIVIRELQSRQAQ
ncbi:MAG: hypothetical protein GY842_08120 [bacterium]|nr:hypothetical protein [bacterium]